MIFVFLMMVVMIKDMNDISTTISLVHSLHLFVIPLCVCDFLALLCQKGEKY